MSHACDRVRTLTPPRFARGATAFLPYPVRLFDAHTHLADARLGREPDVSRLAASGLGAALGEAAAAGVAHAVVCATCEEDWPLVLALCGAPSLPSSPRLLPSVGLHPWRVRGRSPDWAASLESALSSAGPLCGVGEAGVDAPSAASPAGAPLQQQTAVLAAQLDIARRLSRPLSLHVVGGAAATSAALACLRSAAPPSGFSSSGGASVVLHAACGVPDVAPFLALGCMCSFGLGGGLAASAAAALSAPSPPSAPLPCRAARALAAVPLHRLLVETDAPDGLAGVPRAAWLAASAHPDGGGGHPLLRLVGGCAPGARCGAGAVGGGGPFGTIAAAGPFWPRGPRGCGCGRAAASGEGGAQPLAVSGAVPPAGRPLNHPANLAVVVALVASARCREPAADVAAVTVANGLRTFCPGGG